jgi:hypothetical protein
MRGELKIVALAPYDGWAFVRENDNLFLLRPPYTVSSRDRCSPKELAEAVSKHGFNSVDRSFGSYSELIQFVKDEYIKANKDNGKVVPTVEELKELLNYASEDVLLGFLEKAEKELLPEGKIEAAESLILDLMKLDKVIKNKNLFAQALNVIDKIAKVRKEKKAWEMKFMKRRLKHVFSNIDKRYPAEQIMEKIEATHHRGMVFSLP